MELRTIGVFFSLSLWYQGMLYVAVVLIVTMGNCCRVLVHFLNSLQTHMISFVSSESVSLGITVGMQYPKTRIANSNSNKIKRRDDESNI